MLSLWCLLIMLSIPVERLPSGSLHHSETVEHEAEVSKERLEVFLISSVAQKLQAGESWSVSSDLQVC